jgi:glycosyltransferase involved in cell wall biosynthesis
MNITTDTQWRVGWPSHDVHEESAGGPVLNALVSLAPGLSAQDWRVRHSNDEVPDATPYGLHKLESHGVVPVFADRSFSRATRFLSKVATRSTQGVRVVEALADIRFRSQIPFDVVLCYDEWNGIPARVVQSRHAPVIMGVHFLAEQAQTPRVFGAAARLTLPHAAAIFTHTRTMAGILTSEWGVAPDRVTTVPFGIDAEFYAVQPQPEVPGIVVSAGEDVLRDHDLLINAMARLNEKDPQVRLELATGMKVELPPSLGRVFHERLYGKMRDLYRRASVVAVAVHPSAARASGSTVVLEGMASGRPVVATANPALAEFIIDGVTGILVPPGDVDAMTKAIGELLADPARAAEMGRAGAQYVRERFTSDVMAGELAELARSI